MVIKGHIKFTWIFWLFVISVFLVISYRTLFIDVQIQNYYFNELEDFGRYVWLLGVSFVEAFIYILVIQVGIRFLQSLFKKSKT
jgi:hypothetical protein